MKQLYTSDEVDVKTLLLHVLRGWKKNILIILVIMIFCCVYSYDVNQSENMKKESKFEDRKEYVQECVNLENKVLDNEMYKQNSLLLKINPYNVWCLEISISNKIEDMENEIVAILSEKLGYVENEKFIYEILSVEARNNSINVKIYSSDELCIIEVNNALKSYFQDKDINNYVSSTKCVIDLGIKNKQKEIIDILDSEEKDLENMKEKLSEEELRYVEQAIKSNGEVEYAYQEVSYWKNGFIYGGVIGIVLGIIVCMLKEWFKQMSSIKVK